MTRYLTTFKSNILGPSTSVVSSIRSGAWILIPNEHTDQDTSDVSSKTDEDTDQET